jgi:hypothetical protein
VLDTFANAIDESEATPVASAATTDIWAIDGNTVHITGTTTITSFGTAPRVGAWRKVIFDGALTLTDGANLNLPGAANITTSTDDMAFVYAETTTLFKVVYFKVNGEAVVSTGSIEAGTRMLFQQTAAPTGWAKETTAAYENAGIRNTTGAVAAAGTGDTFDAVFSASKTTDGHTLTAGQIPVHAHAARGGGSGSGGNRAMTVGPPDIDTASNTTTVNTTGNAGGGGSHTHPMTMELKFVGVIVAEKS